LSPGDIEIYGNFSGEWVWVKDNWFPTWHADMDGHELRIEESNLNTVLIKSENGSMIHLTHRMFWYESWLSAVSILVLLLVFAALYFRGNSKVEAN
jgi:uncharacterized membrane protein